MADYTTVQVVKSRLDITDTSHDADLSLLITASSRMVDRYCKRADNGFAGATETRTFDVAPSAEGMALNTRDYALLPDTYPGSPWTVGVQIVDIDPLVSITSLSTDEDMDGVFETTWLTTDYQLLPVNAALDGRPYRRIRPTPNGAQSFTAGPSTVQIVGSWGEASLTPPIIQEATILLTSRWFHRRLAPFGVTQDMGAGTQRLPPMDPDVKMMLDEGGYREKWFFV